MSAPDPAAPVGIGLPCAVCHETPLRIVALCLSCNEAIKARLAYVERLEAERDRLRPLAAFGRAALRMWWDDGNPGDADGAELQDAAEVAGLWRRVERHADGVECDWCGGGEPCGELTEAARYALGEKP